MEVYTSVVCVQLLSKPVNAAYSVKCVLSGYTPGALESRTKSMLSYKTEVFERSSALS